MGFGWSFASSSSVTPEKVVRPENVDVRGRLDEAAGAVLNIFCALARALLSAFRSRRDLVFETLALRQQLGVLQRSVKRPRLHSADRAFWVLISGWWGHWSGSRLIVKLATASW